MLSLGIKVSLIQYDHEAPRTIAIASKMTISRKPVESLKAMSDEELDLWIRETLKRGHLSPWEHSSYTLVAEGCSRVCSHQLVRHRLASYTQQSMRYTEASLREMAAKASKAVGMACPDKAKGPEARSAYSCYAEALIEASRKLGDEDALRMSWIGYVIPPELSEGPRGGDYARSLLAATGQYYRLLSQGVPKEDARFLIPMAVRTKVLFTMNARELIQSFLPLRMCTHAQWEIRHVAWLTWLQLVKVHPQLFKYAGPSCVLYNNMALDEPATLEDYLKGKAGFVIARCPELVERDRILSCLRLASRAMTEDPLKGYPTGEPREDEPGAA